MRTVPYEQDRIFCTGADLEQLRAHWTRGNREHVYQYLQAESSLVQECINFTKPWAAGLSGLVTGSGMGLAMHALFRFASPYSVWAVTEPSYGGVPAGYGASYELPRLAGELGTFLALTGRRLLGHDLYHAGLASHMIDPAHYEEMGRSLSKQWTKVGGRSLFV